jgi:hypothetical protein
MLPGSIMGIEEVSSVMKPCRFCELACPVAQGTTAEASANHAQ